MHVSYACRERISAVFCEDASLFSSVGVRQGYSAALDILKTVLGRVALGAQRPIVIKLSRGRSVVLPVRMCVVRASVDQCIMENGGSGPDAIWHHRSDGSRDEADSGVWRSVHGKGHF